MSKRSHKKNRRSSNAKNNKLSSNSEGTMSVPAPHVNDLPQELPPQELPPREDNLFRQQGRSQGIQQGRSQDIQQGQSQDIQQGQSQDIQQGQSQDIQQFQLRPLPHGYVYGKSRIIYVPKNTGKSKTLEELKTHPLFETLQRTMKENEFLKLEYIGDD